jgi:hypothetical protein
MADAIPRNTPTAFRNASLSLVMNSDRIIRYAVTPEMARCIFGSPFEYHLMELATENKIEEEDVDPNIEEYVVKISDQYGLWGNDPV